MGTLRNVDVNSEIKKHMWVMSISDDLSKISFYDPFLKKQIIEIEGKIKNRSILQWYLLATKMNFQAIKYKLEKMESNSSFNLRMKSVKNNEIISAQLKSIFKHKKEDEYAFDIPNYDNNKNKIPILKKLTSKIK
jgi:hypothetical protein